jgi:BON domain-containing protein
MLEKYRISNKEYRISKGFHYLCGSIFLVRNSTFASEAGRSAILAPMSFRPRFYHKRARRRPAGVETFLYPADQTIRKLKRLGVEGGGNGGHMIKGQGQRPTLYAALLAVSLFFSTGVGLASVPDGTLSRLAEHVRHALVMLPYNGVFDNLTFSIENPNKVVLSGQVVRPVTKLDAERAVRKIEGVEQVENRIEVLPLSPFDNTIRRATYRAIFSEPGMEKYAFRAVSPIRIIVKNGNITLDGFVGNQMDRTIAGMAANSVPGAFSVTNNLQVG